MSRPRSSSRALGEHVPDLPLPEGHAHVESSPGAAMFSRGGAGGVLVNTYLLSAWLGQHNPGRAVADVAAATLASALGQREPHQRGATTSPGRACRPSGSRRDALRDAATATESLHAAGPAELRPPLPGRSLRARCHLPGRVLHAGMGGSALGSRHLRGDGPRVVWVGRRADDPAHHRSLHRHVGQGTRGTSTLPAGQAAGG